MNYILILLINSLSFNLFCCEITLEKVTSNGIMVDALAKIKYKKGDVLKINGFDASGKIVIGTSLLAIWFERKENDWVAFRPSRGQIIIGAPSIDSIMVDDGEYTFYCSTEPNPEKLKLLNGMNVSFGYMKISSNYVSLDLK